MLVPTRRQTETPPKRIVGQALNQNPLAAIVTLATEEHLADLDVEIEVTEKYLKGLKAARRAGELIVRGEPSVTDAINAEIAVVVEIVSPKTEPAATPPAKTTEVAKKSAAEPVVTAKPVEVPPVKTTVKPTRVAMGTKPVTEAPPAVTDEAPASKIIRDIIARYPDYSIDQIADVARTRGLGQMGNTYLNATIYRVRNELKKAKEEKPAAPTPKPAPVVEDAPAGETDETPEKKNKSERTLPPKESPHRAAAELTLRKEVAEFLFKKGYAGAGELLKECGVSPRIVQEFMSHPWFEPHPLQKGSWRLTAAGKNEGLEGY